jgi:GNAT superfamily N-acetyltransferase
MTGDSADQGQATKQSVRAITGLPSDLSTHLIPLSEEYLPGALDLWERRFGCERAIAREWLENSLDADKPEETFIAVRGTRVLGLGVCTICTPEYVEDYVALDTGDFTPWDRTGILHVVAVRDDHTGEGLGSQLVEKRLQYLAGEGADGVLGMAWHRDDNVDSRVLFEKYGFQKVRTYERYYARSHGRDDCPDCDGECQCTASVYARSIA